MSARKKNNNNVRLYEKWLLQRGRGEPVFIGRYNQKGYGFGSILSKLIKSAFNVLRKSKLLDSTKNGLRKRVKEAGVRVAKNIIEEKQGFKKSLKEGTKKLVTDVISDVVTSNQSGKGIKTTKSRKRKKRQHEEDEDVFTVKKKNKKRKRGPRKISDIFK